MMDPALLQPAPPAPISVDSIAPVPVDKIDGKGRLKTLMSHAMRALPGESAEQSALRIQKLSDLNSKVDLLGEISPDDADAIFDGWYAPIMGTPQDEFATFSPEARAALQEAYGGSLPQPRIAGASDIDPNEAATVAAYTLVNALSGKGGLGGILKGASFVQGNAQRRVDAQTQAAEAEDKMRRQGALARFQAISEADQFNAGQRGYEAKGNRDAKRQIDVQTAITNRQHDADERRFRNEMAGRYFDFLSKGDSARAADVKAYVEQSLGTKLDDRFQVLNQTSGEAHTDASTVLLEKEASKMDEVIAGLRLKNDLDGQAFAGDLKKRMSAGDLSAAQVTKIQKEVDHLPEKWRLEALKINADVEAAHTRAKAALIKAEKAGSGSGSSGADKAVKQRLDGLKAVVTSQNTLIDNLAQRHNYWLDEIDEAERKIEREKRMNGEKSAAIAGLQVKLANATKNRNDIAKEMSTARERTLAAANEIDKLTGLPHP